MSDLTALAAEAYVYGYPLVCDLDEVRRFVGRGMGTVPPAPYNTFSHATELAGPRDTFVSINNDTVYSMAQLDASGGPISLRVPDVGGRYYVLQFVDAWTDNFAYIGRRATGTREGDYLLVPPDSEVNAVPGATVIHLPTDVVSIVGRWACDGPADLPAVRSLQKRLELKATAKGGGVPEPVAVPEELEFYEKLRVWMAAFPAAELDREYEQRFAPLGLLAETSPYVTPPPELAAALRDGLAEGRDRVEEATRGGHAREENGWHIADHAFDYNTDFFEVGTVRDPRWIIPDRPAAHLVRAAAARAGLWGNHAYEALYAMAWTDGDGVQLNGARTYTIHFASPPPADAFWSLTMYDMPDYHLVTNPIDRYSIGDRTPGLRQDPDGSLTITLSTARPADPANWLPTPPGDFRPILRLYQPSRSVLDGSYHFPPITRT